jgi:acyl carrier protein
VEDFWLADLDPDFRALIDDVAFYTYRQAQAQRGRAAHRVGITAQGVLRVLDAPDIPPHAVFAPGASYPFLLRHSSARGFDDDAIANGRGAALRLLRPVPDARSWQATRAQDLAGGLLDLVLVTGRFFLVRTARAFLRWITADDPAKRAMLAEMPVIAESLHELIRDPESFTALDYHSQVAFRFLATDGQEGLVRYRLTGPTERPDSAFLDRASLRLPLDYVPRRAEDVRSPRYLRDEFARRVRAREACYRLQVQLRLGSDGSDDAALDCTRPWPTERFPWRDVALLELDTLVDQPLAERVAYNPGHAPPELGLIRAESPDDLASIGHLRAIAYEISAAAREGRPLDPRVARGVEAVRRGAGLTRLTLREALTETALAFHPTRLAWMAGPPDETLVDVVRHGPLAEHVEAQRAILDHLRRGMTHQWPVSSVTPLQADLDEFFARLAELGNAAGLDRDLAALERVIGLYRPVYLELLSWDGRLRCRLMRGQEELIDYLADFTGFLRGDARVVDVQSRSGTTALGIVRFASVTLEGTAVILSEYAASLERASGSEPWRMQAGLEVDYDERQVDGPPAAAAAVTAYFDRLPAAQERDFKLGVALLGGLLVQAFEGTLGDEPARQATPARINGDGHAATPRSVCIIGAGAAGLTMARELQRAGHRVTVLERERRVGGKCRSVEIDGAAYDLGAHICGPMYRNVRALAEDVGCTFEPVAPTRGFDFARGVVVNEGGAVYDQRLRTRYLAARQAEFSAGDSGSLERMSPGLAAPVSSWLANNGLEALADAGLGYTACGYGFLDQPDLPALYLARFLDMAGLFPSGASGMASVDRWTIAGGFEELWRRVASGLRDVRLGVDVVEVRRDASGVHVRTTDGVLDFDDMVLACPLDRALDVLDASPIERALFGLIRHVDYSTTLCSIRDLPRQGMYIIKQQDSAAARAGHCTTFLHRYRGSDVYALYAYNPPSGDPGDALALLADDMARAGGTLRVIHARKHWTHFPHVTTSDVRDGFFTQVAALQGVRNTYYLGAVLAFDLVECVVAHARDIAARCFAPPVGAATPVSGARADSTTPHGPDVSARPTGDAPLAPGSIGEFLLAELAGKLHVPVSALRPSQTWDELGLDSLALVSVLARLSDRLGWQVTPSLVIEYPTIGALADFLESEAAAPIG